jgi:hypothetical protein
MFQVKLNLADGDVEEKSFSIFGEDWDACGLHVESS